MPIGPQVPFQLPAIGFVVVVVVVAAVVRKLSVSLC